MDKTHTPMPFPLHISAESHSESADAPTLLRRFIEQASHQYDVTILSPVSGTPTQADATISVPFADRERFRITFNIFASEMDDTYGTDLFFHMESAF